jgi:tripartite-type tricarboxylate transporter receptor subunit TctC
MTKLPRRRFLHMAAAVAALSTSLRVAWAQTYPMRLVRLVVPYPPGASTDITARLVGQSLSDRLGQPFVVENRPGAGGNIGTDAVAKSAPDGYTLLLVYSSNAINATLYERLSFNFMRDIAPVAAIMRVPNVVLVHPSVSAKTIPAFIELAKANPGKLNMASGGNGSTGHLAGELFKMMTGVDLVHVPYRGGAPALTDLIAGQVQVFFAPMPAAIEYIRTGKLHALGVTTPTRSEVLPEIPPVGDFVPGYEASTFLGIGAPKNTPPQIIERLNSEINLALADPNVKARLADLSGTELAGSPVDFGKLIADETEKWAKVIMATNIKTD